MWSSLGRAGAGGGRGIAREAVVRAQTARAAELAQEEQAVDIGKAPRPALPDLDPGEVGGQVRGLARP